MGVRRNGTGAGGGVGRRGRTGTGSGDGGGGGGALRNWAPQSSSLIFVLLFDVFYVPCWAAGVLADRDHNPVQLLSSQL